MPQMHLKSLRHLQDFAASLWLLFTGKGLLAQQFSDQPQGIDLFLQAFQFGFFSTEDFHGVLHGLSLMDTLRGQRSLWNVTEVRGNCRLAARRLSAKINLLVLDFRPICTP